MEVQAGRQGRVSGNSGSRAERTVRGAPAVNVCFPRPPKPQPHAYTPALSPCVGAVYTAHAAAQKRRRLYFQAWLPGLRGLVCRAVPSPTNPPGMWSPTLDPGGLRWQNETESSRWAQATLPSRVPPWGRQRPCVASAAPTPPCFREDASTHSAALAEVTDMRPGRKSPVAARQPAWKPGPVGRARSACALAHSR